MITMMGEDGSGIEKGMLKMWQHHGPMRNSKWAKKKKQIEAVACVLFFEEEKKEQHWITWLCLYDAQCNIKSKVWLHGLFV